MTESFVTMVVWMAAIAVVWVLARRLTPGDEAADRRRLSCGGLGCGGACRPGPGRDCETGEAADAATAPDVAPDETAYTAAGAAAGAAAGGSAAEDGTGPPRSDRFDGEPK